MAEKLSVILALIVHYLLRLSFFLKFPDTSQCLAVVPSLMVLASVTVALFDCNMLPKKYKGVPGMKSVEIGIEAIVCLFSIELVMALIWAPIEVFCNVILTLIFKNIYGPRLAQFLATTVLSTVANKILCYALTATGNMQAVKQNLEKALVSVISVLCCCQNKSASSNVRRCQPCEPSASIQQSGQTQCPSQQEKRHC